MNGILRRIVISFIFEAVLKINSSLSITQGPAINTKGLPPPIFISFNFIIEINYFGLI